jgi:Tol biopolymer transport system component
MHRILLILSMSLLLLVSIVGAMGVGAAFPGDELAFHGPQITVMDLRTGIMRILLRRSAGVGLTWSPDSKHMTFVRVNDNLPGIYLTDSVGAPPRFLASGYGAVWLPDGQRIAFLSHNDDRASVLDLDTDRVTPMSENGAGPSIPAAWSPDGTLLAYIDSRPSATHIYVANSVTGETHWLAEGHSPDWSPDGEKIVYVFNSQIFVIPATGGTSVSVTQGFNPVWSPDGARLAFARGDYYLSDIMLYHLDSGREVVLVSNGSPNTSPAWRPR